MKKLALLAILTACVSAQALPTYEPFSEFAPTLASNPTNMVVSRVADGSLLGTNANSSLSNCLDLATGGYTAPSGELWGNLNFGGTSGGSSSKVMPLFGLDTAVVSNSLIFPAYTLSSLLPSTFPGFDPNNGFTYFAENPEQPYLWNGTTFVGSNYVGNSAVLRFSQDFTRPTNGIKTLYFSYVFSVSEQGQLGGGNDGRYLSLLAATNLVEGTNVGVVAYTNWGSLFNTFGGGVHYVSHGLLQNGTGFFIGACDSTIGKTFNQSTNTTSLTGSYNTPVFVVGAYVMNATNGVKDTNMMWVNPSVSAFGGATPPSSAVHAYAMPFNMSDLGGLVLENRTGNGALGGMGTNFVANLLIGSTWSYVTGGPEFTNHPVSITGTLGGTYSFTAAAVAAAQNVTYQWQKVSGGVTNNLTDGTGTAGGSATVSGSTTGTLTVTGISSGDLGAYQLVATASGTGYSLASSAANLVVDPIITTQPQSMVTNYGGVATFTAVASTAHSSMTYQWQFNGSPLTDGVQADGSVISGSRGTITGGALTSTLNISSVTYQEAGNYTIVVSNNFDNISLSSVATLTVLDPFITSQPTNTVAAAGTTATFTVGASGSPTLFYQWYANGNPLFDGSGISGSQSSTLTISGVSDANAGSYYVTIAGSSGQSTNSATVTLMVADPVTLVTGPVSRTERVGDHTAFVVSAAGNLLSYQWQFNGTDISGATSSALVLTNIQTANAGTYTAVVKNLASTSSASATLNVINSTVLPLSPTNIIVARVGDGAQALSGSGNTIYLDQYTTNGVYVDTLQVPDEGAGQAYRAGSSASVYGSPALLAQGAGSDAPNSLFLTLSGSDHQYLNFVAYCQQYPYSGTDVTTGAAGNWRGLASINASGIYSLVYTNTGLCNGGNHTVRGIFTLDDTNFWSSGQAGANGLKFMNTTVASYANGGGIPALYSSATGVMMIGVFNGNLVYSDTVGLPGIAGPGIFICSNTPEPLANQTITNSTQLIGLEDGGMPNDFAFSPDGQTVYIADSVQYNGGQGGGIQRWDTNAAFGGYSYSYTLAPLNGATNGAQGLTVYFPPGITTWGPGVTGAVLYATTYGATTNSLVKIVDTGSSSTGIVVATAGPNQAFRGVRFGPSSLPVTIASQPQNQTAITGSGALFSVGVTGTAPIYYQWQFNGINIAGATGSSLTVDPAQAALPGSYTVIVSNLVPSVVTSAPVSISFVPVLGFNGNGSGWSMNGTAGSGLPIYGYNGGSNIVELTQGGARQLSSTFYQYPVYVGGFLASWTYQVQSSTNALADGMAFVVQNDPHGPKALSGSGAGGSLGYGNPLGITNSVALEFDIYTNSTVGYGIGVDTNGNLGPDLNTSPVMLASGDPINVTVQYLNGIATVTLFDTVTSNTFTTNAAVNVPAVVGGNQAYVGFTAANGSVVSTQTVSNFVYYSLVNLTSAASGNSLTLSWPTGVGGYVLQSSPTLAPANWVNVTNAASEVNGSNQVVVPVSGSSNVFYRLVNP